MGYLGKFKDYNEMQWRDDQIDLIEKEQIRHEKDMSFRLTQSTTICLLRLSNYLEKHSFFMKYTQEEKENS